MDPHTWFDYDDSHRSCLRCGLRVAKFALSYGRANWVVYNFFGVPSPPLFDGGCRPPPAPPIEESVFIQYTGNPDEHPGCERIMHRFPGGSYQGLIDLATVRPVCGARAVFWEIGPARDWPGWTWCLDCWVMRIYRGRKLPDVHAQLPPKPAPALPAPVKKLPKPWGGKLIR